MIQEEAMSSGTFQYSLEEQAALLAQFGSVMGIVNERQRPAARVSQVLQAVISDDDIIVVPKVVVTPQGKVFHVSGNARTAAEAMDALKCPVRWGLAAKPDQIPLVFQPVDCSVRAVPLGQTVRTDEIFSLYPRVASPITAVYFGTKFQEEQREATHFTVWLDGLGQFWCVVLNVRGGERRVGVDRRDPGGRWLGGYRLLVCE